MSIALLLGIVGGNLGLFTGFSVMTGFEFLEFTVMALATYCVGHGVTQLRDSVNRLRNSQGESSHPVPCDDEAAETSAGPGSVSPLRSASVEFEVCVPGIGRETN